MNKSAAVLMIVCLLSACSIFRRAPPSPEDLVVRTVPPRNHESSIANYFDARAKAADPPRELVVGAPQRGTCPMGAKSGGYVGWVVPVEHRTRSKDSGVVTVTTYFFWFSDEIIRGVTRRMELCP
jgi:hypothetical protein